MYRVVYFHKTTRAAEVMLRLVFQRYRALLGEDVGPDLPGAAPALRCVFLADGGAQLADYLELDDHTVTEFLKIASRSGDHLLRTLANGLLNRVLYKAIDVTDEDPFDQQMFRRTAEDRVRELGHDADYAFVSDRPADTPYKPYEPSSDAVPNQIYVEGSDGAPHEISRLSRQVAELMPRYTLVRHYYPADLRDEILGLARATFRRVQ
jgi:uncharacterized protein